MAPSHAFISHSPDDTDKAEEIRKQLESRGIICTNHEFFKLDRTDGQNINSLAEKCYCFVLLLSNNFVKCNCDWTTIQKNLAILKSKMAGRTCTIAVNIDLPTTDPGFPKAALNLDYFQYSNEHSNEAQVWDDLAQAIKNPKPLGEVLGAGDVAHGLALNYFFGFLEVVVPELKQKQKLTAWLPENFPTKDAPVIDQLFVLVPSSCKIPSGIMEFDPENIEPQTPDISISMFRAGQNRTFTIHMFKVTHPTNRQKVRYAALAANSTVDHILKMHENEPNSSYWLSQEQMLKQREIMELKLQDWIQASEMKDFVKVIKFDDSNKDLHLAELILEEEKED